jgi:hypothetical protein
MAEELLRDSGEGRWDSPLCFPRYCSGRLDLHGPDLASALQAMASGGGPETHPVLHLQFQRDRVEETFLGTARLRIPLHLQGLDTVAWTWRPALGCRVHLALDRDQSAHVASRAVNAANTMGASAALSLRSATTMAGALTFPELPALEGLRCQVASVFRGDRTAAVAVALEARRSSDSPSTTATTATTLASAWAEEPWLPDRLLAAMTYSRGNHTSLTLRAEVWPTAAKPTLALVHSRNLKLAGRLVSVQVRVVPAPSFPT